MCEGYNAKNKSNFVNGNDGFSCAKWVFFTTLGTQGHLRMHLFGA